MKFNVLRSFLIPWFLFFLVSVTLLVLVPLKLPARFQDPKLHLAILIVGGFLCLVANSTTLNKAGIWIADSLSYSVRNSSWSAIGRALRAALIAGVFYGIGQVSWIPLYWQGFVIPFVFTLAIFVIVKNLVGLTLKTAGNLTFIRFFIFMVSLPLLVGVAVTAQFLSQNIVSSYVASQPDFTPKSLEVEFDPEKPNLSKNLAQSPRQSASAEDKRVPAGISKRAKEFQALAEHNLPCVDQDKEIQGALDPKTNEDVAYWAIKAIKCTDMKAVVVLPRLVDIMIKHKSPRVRAAAIMMMSKYGHDNVKQISYLLVKRLNEKEPKEVLEAAATVLSKLGEEERGLVTRRLKLLLDSHDASVAGAEILIGQMNRPDLVADYVSSHLNQVTEGRERAIAMVCLLPQEERAKATPYISEITAAIKQGLTNDPAMEALACVGPAGLQAVRQEVQHPKKLPRTLAAQALAEMDLKNDAETLKTVDDCLKDENQEVRKWCSYSMGKIGRLAIPQILDLLKSKDAQQLEAGHLALESLTDPDAKEDLRRVRAENSGWMANRKNLQVASAVSTALVRIENER